MADSYRNLAGNEGIHYRGNQWKSVTQVFLTKRSLMPGRYKIGLKDCEKLYSLFSRDFYANIDSIREAAQKKRMFNLIHNESIVKIDFIVRKDDKFPKVEFERRRKIDFEGLNIWIASPEDLILSKLSWARESRSETQIRDVNNLIKSVAGLDFDYIRKWVTKLGLDEIYQTVSK